MLRSTFTSVLLVALIAGACSKVEDAHDQSDHDHADHDHAVDHEHDDHAEHSHGEAPANVDPNSALGEFRAQNSIDDPAGWMHVELRESDITGTRRRISVDKYAVGQALLGWGGLSDTGEPMPIRYAPGTLFVAESLDAAGGVAATFITEFNDDGEPTFRAYDARGDLVDRVDLAGSHGTAAVPADCQACHLGPQFYPPMSAYPLEDERVALDVDPRHRDGELVATFGEQLTRGSGVVGPYGGMLVAGFAADMRDDRLAKFDEYGMFILSQRYAELLGLPPMGGDDDDAEKDG